MLYFNECHEHFCHLPIRSHQSLGDLLQGNVYNPYKIYMVIISIPALFSWPFFHLTLKNSASKSRKLSFVRIADCSKSTLSQEI